MKKMFLLLAGLCALTEVLPQQKTMSGIICFTEISKLELKIEGDASQFSQNLPNEIKAEKELLFNKDASVYRKKAKEADIKEMADDSNQAMRIFVNEPDYITYTNLSDGKIIEQREFMTRMFIIEGSNKSRVWKLTGNSQEVLGYTCQEAQTTRDSILIKAWFAPEIPVSTGPVNFGGLPGMVLLVDYDNGRRIIKADKIEFREIATADMEIPKKGKVVTEDEFREMVAEKAKEQGATGGGGAGTMTIVIKK